MIWCERVKIKRYNVLFSHDYNTEILTGTAQGASLLMWLHFWIWLLVWEVYASQTLFMHSGPSSVACLVSAHKQQTSGYQHWCDRNEQNVSELPFRHVYVHYFSWYINVSFYFTQHLLSCSLLILLQLTLISWLHACPRDPQVPRASHITLLVLRFCRAWKTSKELPLHL